MTWLLCSIWSDMLCPPISKKVFWGPFSSKHWARSALWSSMDLICPLTFSMASGRCWRVFLTLNFTNFLSGRWDSARVRRRQCEGLFGCQEETCLWASQVLGAGQPHVDIAVGPSYATLCHASLIWCIVDCSKICVLDSVPFCSWLFVRENRLKKISYNSKWLTNGVKSMSCLSGGSSRRPRYYHALFLHRAESRSCSFVSFVVDRLSESRLITF